MMQMPNTKSWNGAVVIESKSMKTRIFDAAVMIVCVCEGRGSGFVCLRPPIHVEIATSHRVYLACAPFQDLVLGICNTNLEVFVSCF